MVSDAQRSRAPVQRLAEQVASYFVPTVIGSAIVTAMAWTILGPVPSYAHALLNAVAVLIIACPCALGLATPMSIMVGTGRGAQAGLFVRNAEALEMLEKVKVLLVDKTGTLIEGKPRLMSVVCAACFSEQDVLQLAASLEQGSDHPLATAIIAEGRARQITLLPIGKFTSVTGLGVVVSMMVLRLRRRTLGLRWAMERTWQCKALG